MPHHPDAWARTGTTSLSEAVLLCDSEHGAVHRGQTITLKDGRRLNEHGWVAQPSPPNGPPAVPPPPGA